jgi:L-ascorbate metabolism protein UlaG (beta-lactamase superfamily)
MNQSSNFKNGKFENLEPTPVMIQKNSMFSTMWEWIKGPENGTPDIVETNKFNKQEFLFLADSSFKITWFGHSSVLINMGGKVILTDPVFNTYASPIPYFNKSFKYSNPIIASDLPDVDYLLISHDHYDHLDRKTIQDLDEKVKMYYVPLGVDAHLKRWGVNSEKIVVADWWDEFKIDENLIFASTPARHFSGRGFNRNSTLWCSWVIKSNEGSVYFGADSGYGKHFKMIGEKYGPFDLTMIECGQYNENWANIHAMPEQSVQAHIDLKGEKMMTIHWSKFQLSLHSWTEPIERARAEAQRLNVELMEPQIGDVVTLH